MTNAEFKTRAESLGLSVEWWADSLGVQRRTVEYWMAGRPNATVKVPLEAIDIINSIDGWMDACVDNVMQVLAHQAQAIGLPSELALLRYKSNADLWRFQPELKESNIPYTAHAMMLERVRRSIKTIPVKIVYMNVEQYLEWLNGRPESSDMRASWAGLQ